MPENFSVTIRVAAAPVGEEHLPFSRNLTSWTFTKKNGVSRIVQQTLFQRSWTSAPSRYNEAADASLARTIRSRSLTTPMPPRRTWPKCTTHTMPTKTRRLRAPEAAKTVPREVQKTRVPLREVGHRRKKKPNADLCLSHVVVLSAFGLVRFRWGLTIGFSCYFATDMIWCRGMTPCTSYPDPRRASRGRCVCSVSGHPSPVF